MQITHAEKLILIMLSDIQEHLDIKGDIDPKFVKSAIGSGNAWGLASKYSMLFQGKAETPDNVKEVMSLLKMWTKIESDYGRLSAEDKQLVKVEAHPYGTDVQFPGFDLNDECEGEYVGIARFIVDDLHQFPNFQARGLNSWGPMLDKYRKMLAVYETMRPQIPDIPTPLTAAQIVSLLTELRNPSL